jgi:hypothetical protein
MNASVPTTMTDSLPHCVFAAHNHGAEMAPFTPLSAAGKGARWSELNDASAGHIDRLCPGCGQLKPVGGTRQAFLITASIFTNDRQPHLERLAAVLAARASRFAVSSRNPRSVWKLLAQSFSWLSGVSASNIQACWSPACALR